MAQEGPLRPEDITRRRFPTVFRGLDAGEVRAFLALVADDLAWTRSREEDLRQQLAAAQAAPPPPLDEATLTAALGEETARIVHTAQQAAADIRARADENVAQLLREAHSEAERVRSDSDGLLALRVEEADAAAAQIRESAEAQAQSVVQEAAWRSQQLVHEAEATRDRILADLADRRRVAHLQVEQLEAGRERLLQAYAVVRSTLDAVTAELDRVEHEAPAAAEAIARRAEQATAPPPKRIGPEPDEEPEPEPEEVEAFELAIIEPADDIESVRVIGPAPKKTESPKPEVPTESTSPASANESTGAGAEVFARIRAERASAEKEDPAPPVTVAQEQETTLAPTDEQLKAARDAVLEPLVSVLARKVKRALQDEQNDVLDRLRLQRRLPTLDELLLAEHDQVARYADVAHDVLLDAARAGAGEHPVSVKSVAKALACDIVNSLRHRLARSVEETIGSPDPEALGDGVSAAYREWKSSRIERLSADHLAAAHALGVYEATAPGTRLRWVVDDVDGPCPDCDDNSLAGPTPRGEGYPTGQPHPPAHAGCRCLLVPEPT